MRGERCGVGVGVWVGKGCFFGGGLAGSWGLGLLGLGCLLSSCIGIFWGVSGEGAKGLAAASGACSGVDRC